MLRFLLVHVYRPPVCLRSTAEQGHPDFPRERFDATCALLQTGASGAIDPRILTQIGGGVKSEMRCLLFQSISRQAPGPLTLHSINSANQAPKT